MGETGTVGSQFTDERTEAGRDLVRDGQRGQQGDRWPQPQHMGPWQGQGERPRVLDL